MYKKILFLALLVIVTILSARVLPACFLDIAMSADAYDANGVRTNITSNPRNEADFILTETKVYRTRSCFRAKRALKKLLKDKAKDICRRHGSPRYDLLRCTVYSKSCTTFRNSNGQRRARVTGTFEGACR